MDLIDTSLQVDGPPVYFTLLRRTIALTVFEAFLMEFWTDLYSQEMRAHHDISSIAIIIVFQPGRPALT
jgi:hypothetical protein